jgi:hypothetical protein
MYRLSIVFMTVAAVLYGSFMPAFVDCCELMMCPVMKGRTPMSSGMDCPSSMPSGHVDQLLLQIDWLSPDKEPAETPLVVAFRPHPVTPGSTFPDLDVISPPPKTSTG